MNEIKLQFGDVREKNIYTKNDFISHMIEHIAWRLGTKISLNWDNEDWLSLGKSLGKEIKKFPSRENFGVALGMIDDGGAEVKIELGKAGVQITSTQNINLDWFLLQRCEQLSSGKPLVTLLEGLSEGLGARIEIVICNFEDPHHTWEGIYRGIGIALSKIFTPVNTLDESKNISSFDYALTSRGTAETGVSIGVDFTRTRQNTFSIKVNDSINVNGIERLLEYLAKNGGFTMQVAFNAKILSSSHVVMEDIGLVLGKTLLEILKVRMEQYGVNGAGSSLQTIADFTEKNVRVGISVEGRKFWCFIPFSTNYSELKERFLIGQNVYSNLRSEDLDDFIDGLSGGLSGSIMINLIDYKNVESTWVEIFGELGVALKEVFKLNPYRKDVPPGVKATLN